MNNVNFNPSDFVESIGTQFPRDYQLFGVSEIVEAFNTGFRRIEVIGPTGCGKTLTSKLIVLSNDVRKAIGFNESRPLRVMFLSNRHRLNRQAELLYSDLDSVEIIPQSAHSDIPDHIVKKGWDLTIMDECHHEAMMSVQVLLDKLIKHPIIGFTADNTRSDGILCKFEKSIVLISEKEAAEKGYIEKVGINTIIDYSGKNKVDIGFDFISNFYKSMGNSIVFMRTSNEVKALSKKLTDFGLSVSYIDEKSTESNVDQLLNDLSNGKIQFLLNCNKIGEGVDTPNCTDTILLRGYFSRAEKKQHIGRCIRSDSPSQVWELVNPLSDVITASECVGASKFKRLFCKNKDQWNIELIEGEDLLWGLMSELRLSGKYENFKDHYKSSFISGGSLSLKKLGINTNNYSESENHVDLTEWFKSRKSKTRVNDLFFNEGDLKIA